MTEYRNPILHADWSDPDVVRVGADFYLVASSFNCAPGLPLLHSRDLVNWSILGHALPRLVPEDFFAVPRHGCGVWAPAIRHHDGRFWIFYPDPDHGIHVTTAVDPAGPWTPPRLLKAGKGLIDPCPLWDEDGSAYLVYAWAKSRAGINNRLTCHRMSPDATELLDEGTVIIDGDALPGYRTLEGPKFYRRDGWYYVFAPAGGVKDGWQSVFRAKDVFGPYEDRIVLAQGDTPVNGPHQGAWVTTAEGEDWFLHFQDKGPFGRVVHLQPVRWTDDGWPEIGSPAGSPVSAHTVPAVAADVRPARPASADEFRGSDLGPQWSWAANPRPGSFRLDPLGGLHLTCLPDAPGGDLRDLPHLLGQRLPAESFRAFTTVGLDQAAAGARAGLAITGRTYAWIGLERTEHGVHLVHRTAGAGEPERDAAPPVPVDGPVTLGVAVRPDGTCAFSWSPDATALRPIGGAFPATPGQWVGATIGLFAAGTAGSAYFGHFHVLPLREKAGDA